MFEQITLRRTESNGPITIGHLAEAMLYYQHVHLFLDRNTITHLAQQLGPAEFVSTLARPSITYTFTPQFLGTITTDYSGMKLHNFGALSFVKDKNNRKIDTEYLVREGIESAGVDKGTASRLARKFLEKSKTRSYDSNHFVAGGISAAARHEADREGFLESALREGLIEELQGSMAAQKASFSVTRLPDGYFVSDNLDWAAINLERRRRESTTSEITVAHLISCYLDAIADMHISGFYGGEYQASATSSKIARIRFGNFLRRVGRGNDSIRAFQVAILDDCAAVRQCINSGDRTFKEFLKLVDCKDAIRFKDFWSGVNPDENVLRAYYDECSKRGWLEKIQTKTLRWLICTSVGFVEPITGAALSAADNFLVERMKFGWLPSHFVEGRLKPFIA